MAKASRSIAAASLVGALATVLVVGGGCEFIVADTLPAFECAPGPNTCPEGKVCDPGTSRCVAQCTPASCPGDTECDAMSLLCVHPDAALPLPADAAPEDSAVVSTVDVFSHEAAADANDANDATAIHDAVAEEAATQVESGACSQSGCPCSGPSSCDSKICVDMLTIGAGVYNRSAGNFCTKPCCTSADCDGSTVCYATATGGNYCVLPTWLDRSTAIGKKTSGQSCTANGDCRSGLCANSACADTCCSTAQSASECAPETTCSFGTFPGLASPFDQNYIAFCGPGGTGQNGSTCTLATDCQSNYCEGSSGMCHNACRNSTECGTGQVCIYVRDTAFSSVIAACFPQQPGSGTTAEGALCTTDQDCASNFCVAITSASSEKRCTNVCFGNSDCTMAGWRCRPQYVTLRSGGMTSVTCCGT
jgi:hypothetical protein